MTATRTRATGIRFALAILGLAASWLAMLLLGNGPVDRSVYEALYAGGHPVLVSIARIFTFLGEPTVLIVASFVVAIGLWIAGHRHLPFVVIAVTMVGRGLNEAQKHWIARARPDFETHLVIVKTQSFPSGHSTSSMIFYLMLALILTEGSKWRHVAVAGAILLAVCVGVSRVMLGVHWPSDVIGGWAFGMLWVLLTLRVAQRFVENDLRR